MPSTRIKGNSSPVSFEISLADGAAFDGSQYDWFISAVERQSDGTLPIETASPFYAISPTAGTWNAGLGVVIFDLSVAQWNNLEADKVYVFQCEGFAPGSSPAKPLVTVQEDVEIVRTARLRA